MILDYCGVVLAACLIFIMLLRSCICVPVGFSLIHSITRE
jgi:hypothetical protein